jgi:hypothetical protein
MGGEDAVGVLYPNLFGPSEEFPGVRVDARLNIWLLFANEAESIDAVREGLSQRTVDTSHTTWQAFVGAIADSMAAGAVPTPGWQTLSHPCGTYAWSTIPPVYAVTFGAHGDASGSGYVSSAADITRRVAATRGDQPFTDPTEIDTGAFDDLNAATLGSVTLADVPIDGYVSEQMSVADYVALILRSVGAFAWTKRGDGKLTVKRFEGAGAGTAVATFQSDDLWSGPRDLKAVHGVEPVADVLLGFRPNWQVLSLADITEDMKNDPLVRFATEPWRWASARRGIGTTSTVAARADVLRIETRLTNPSHARDEAVRRRALFSTKPQELEIKVPVTSTPIDVFDEIVFHARERDFRTGEWIDRLNTAEDTQLVVLAVSEATQEGSQTLRIFRQNEAA